MKFNLLKISCLAMAATTVSAADPHSLRGPALVSDAAADFVPFKLAEASCGSHKKKKDCNNDKDCKWDKDDSTCGDASGNNNRNTNTNCEDYTSKSDCNADNDCEWDKNGNNGDGECDALSSSIDDNGKEKAAEKHQDTRDRKRSKTDPDRTQEQENKERGRKSKQAANDSGRRDPYASKGYDKKREAKRLAECEKNGNSCKYSGPSSECYNDCKGNGSNRRQNEDCSQTCKYIEVNCYEDCRDPDGGDNSISTCLGDCEVNMDDDTKKKIKDRTTRDMDCMDECEEKHGSSGAKYDKCVGKCDDEGILSFN